MNTPKQTLPSILHCCSTTDSGGMQTRCIRLIRALGTEARHALVIEGEGQLPGSELLGAKVSRPTFPPLTGAPWPGRLKRLAAAMAGYDLICTYGAGALDVSLAHTLFADVYKLAPLVHHEGAGDGGRSNLYRRIALGRTAALVVPNREAERIALESWQQPRQRVRLIPAGIETAAFAGPSKRDAVPGLIKRRGELWLGTFASPEMLGPLIGAVATLPEEWQLVIAAEGRSHDAILADATRAGIEDRVHPVRAPADVAQLIALFDLFAETETDACVLEAMAAGLPIIGPRDREAGALVASENGAILTAPDDEAELVSIIGRLAGDKALRRRIGEANRAKARAEFDQSVMIERTRALCRSLLGIR